jgi:hypothetical protein
MQSLCLGTTVGPAACDCNGLLATIDLAQTQSTGYAEPALLMAGDDLTQLGCFVKDGADRYSASDVLEAVLKVPEPVAASCRGGTRKG